MLSDLLMKLTNIQSECNVNLNNQQIIELKKILKHFSGGVLPIPTMRRELNISSKEVLELMVYLESKGILKSKFKVYCPDSNACAFEKFYDNLRDVPKKQCDKCDKGCVYIENIIVVFEVI